MLAKDSNVNSWQNLKQLAAGQEIEVTKTKGRPVRGAFMGFVDQSISVREKQQEIAIPRADVARVQLRPAKRGRYLWIGAAVGAGAGAGVGLGIGEGVANESGGDFRNLKPAITGVSAGLGALVGAVIGSAIGGSTPRSTSRDSEVALWAGSCLGRRLEVRWAPERTINAPTAETALPTRGYGRGGWSGLATSRVCASLG